MKTLKKGMILILSGPAGAGKTTYARMLCERMEKCCLSISSTTRKPRSGEIDGKDYFFLTRDDFEKNIKDNNFAEYAEFSSNYYGTPKTFLNERLAEGKIIVLDIEVKGAEQIKQNYPEDTTRIFLLPPTPQDLINRLIGRKTESMEEVSRRMAIAREEILHMKNYNYFLVNDVLEETYKKIEAIITAERHRIHGDECEKWLGGAKAEDILKVKD